MHLISVALIGLFVFTSSVATPIPTEADQIIPGSSEQVSAVAASKVPVAPSEKKLAVRDHQEAEATYTVGLTAYNAVVAQTDGDPMTTASGARSNSEVIAARSHDLAADLPFGTIISITRTVKDTPRCQFGAVEHLIGYRVIADTTHARFTKRVDVELPYDATVPLPGMGHVSAARALGVCDQVVVRAVGRVSLSEVPATQAELARLVEGTALALR